MVTDEFDQQYMDRLAAARHHWWVDGMRAVGSALIGTTAGPLDVLDAGCGAGTNLDWAQALSGGGTVRAVDVSWPAVSHSRTLPGSAAIAQASVAQLPFEANAFDAVLCLDVLQHVDEQAQLPALREIARVLRPRGWVLLRTGAVCGRRGVASRRDWRLYEPGELADLLRDAGLSVERLTAANVAGGAWSSLQLALRRARAGSSHHHDHHDHASHAHGDTGPDAGSDGAVPGLAIPEPVAPWRNSMQRRLVELEARWLREPGRALRFGHSVYALAAKPDDGARPTAGP